MLICHGHFVIAHFACADRMIQRLAGCTDPRIKLIIIVDIDIARRLHLLAAIGVKGFLQENIARLAETVANINHILLDGQIIRINCRSIAGLADFSPKCAAFGRQP